MAPKVLVHFGFKEGTGRSTMNAAFAFLLGRMKESTLFIDLDPSTTATKILAKTYKLDFNPERTIYTGLTQGALAPQLVNVNESLSILPGDWRLSLWNPVGTPTRLRDFLAKVPRRFKYVIIDMPSTQSPFTDCGLFAATNVFLTLENQKNAYLTFSDDVQYLQDLRAQIGQTFTVSGVLLSVSRGNPTSKANQQFLLDARTKFKHAVLTNPSWYQERVKTFTTEGISSKGTWDMRVLQMYQSILNEELTRIEA